MAKFNGGGFGGGNMGNLMRQAQMMQQKMQEAQEELANTEVIGAASGMVEVSMQGDRTLNSITIKPEAVDPSDVEMLEDLIVAAFNDALKKVEELSQELLGPLAGGVGGLF